jgi:hypothetical protein
MRVWPLQQYLLVMSVVDALYVIIMTVMVTLLSNCAWEKKNNTPENVDMNHCLLFSVLDILLSDYFTSCLALFNIITEIVVTCQRVVLITNNSETLYRPWVVCLVIFIISLAVYSPLLFMSKVYTEEMRNATTGVVHRGYYPARTDFGRSKVSLFIKQTTAFLRMGLVLVVLSIVNLIASIKYTAFYNRKSALTEIIRGYLLNFKNSSSHKIFKCYFFI